MKKAKWFTIKNCDVITKEKLVSYAKNIREQKNIVSEMISKNFIISYKYKDEIITNDILSEMFFHPNRYKVNNFVTNMTTYRNADLVDGIAYQQLCRQIYTMYVNKFDAICYKCNNNDDEITQEIKKFLYEHPKETLQEYNEYLTYLINNIDKYKYLHLNILQGCLQQLNNVYSIIHQLHLDYLNNLKAINFKSLTFTNINTLVQHKNQELTYTIEQINNKQVKIDLNIPNKGIITVYSKYNQNYFGNIKEFKHGTRKKSDKVTITHTYITYTLKFLNNGNLKIIFFKDDKEYNKPFYSTQEKAIGIDLNTKHNFLQCSDGKSFNYDDYIIKKEKGLRYYLKKIAVNKSKNHNQNHKHGRKLKQKEEKQVRRRLAHANQKASELKDYCLQNNIKRVVFEDLNISLKTPKKLKKNQDFLQNHKQTALLFNDFKNIAKRILNKANIEVDFVNPRYTSKTCPICGCIEDANRQTQEEFHCVKCGYTNNADLNASINILERIIIDDLRKDLEYYNTKEKMYQGKDYKNKAFYQQIYSKAKQTV